MVDGLVSTGGNDLQSGGAGDDYLGGRGEGPGGELTGVPENT
jgi:hypothetical protein